MDKILRLPYYGVIALLIYMPFHIFLSQWLSSLTGGLDAWKAGKDILLLVLTSLAVGLVWFKQGFKNKLFWTLVAGSLAYLAIHFSVWLANPGSDSEAALLGTAYNTRLFAFAILGWAAGLTYPGKLEVKKVFKILVAVSSLIALLGVIQYFLPKDFMTHFGYSLERGVRPAFFIDSKPDFPRIMSTLRDPNSLGAYLIIPITLLSGLWLKKPKSRTLISGLLLLHGLALFLTFSRSAWLGAFVSVLALAFWSYKRQTILFFKKYWVAISGVTLIILIGGFLLRDQYVVQNYIFHSDENTKMTDSNNLHVDFAQKGIEGIKDMPLGHGPGTAGLVSIQTDNVVLTENYFIQIAYEVGVQGLILLLALMFFIIKLLLKRNDFYSRVLIASFLGITLCAMLLHTWSNEAVAATWFLLSGLLLAKSRVK